MNIGVSYFYQIRFFKPYMLPISTAVWDPKWYHNGPDKNVYNIDKNNVMIGLRLHCLAPGPKCMNLCHGTETCLTGDPNTCAFLRVYREQIENIPKEVLEYKLETLCKLAAPHLHLEVMPMPVLIVYEVPSKLCSERGVLIDVLSKKGFNISELKYPIPDNYR